MNDTLPEIEKKMRELLMARSGAERVIMAASMFDSARTMVLASLPSDLTDEELKRKLCERTYGVSLEHFCEG
jgi:hypothetical protein